MFGYYKFLLNLNATKDHSEDHFLQISKSHSHIVDCRQLHEIATKVFIFLEFDTKIWNRRFGTCNLRRILDVKHLESFFLML